MAEGEPLALVHAGSDAEAERAVAAICAAYRLQDEPPEEPPLIHERIGPEAAA